MVRLLVPAVIRHLYVHIPFCPKICPYCSFYKEAHDRNKTQPFLEALLRELELRQEAGLELRPETIFFGGGTPSALTVAQLEFLLGGLRARLDLSELAEWTLEMNPATVSQEKARLLRELGVTRVSMGVQSWDPAVLATLGRIHTVEQARRSYDFLRGAGFANVNLDHIFAVPGQSLASWEATLTESIALRPEHVSAYNLTYEEDTEFMRRFLSGEFRQDDDEDAAFFERTAAWLEAAGYPAYETSNFAPPGNECRHNLAYWRGADYLGLGPSAFSTVGPRRWSNVRDTAGYTARILAGEWAEGSSEPLSESTRRSESIAFGLRMREGIAADWLDPWPDERQNLVAGGLLELTEARARLTPRGRLVADEVAALFV